MPDTPLYPVSGALALKGGVPTLAWTITLGAGALGLVGGTPILLRGTVLTPTAASLSLSGGTPTLLRGNAITVNGGALSLAGGQPGLLNPQLLTPGSGSLTFIGGSPLITMPGVLVTGARVLKVGAGMLNLMIAQGNVARVQICDAPSLAAAGGVTVIYDAPLYPGQLVDFESFPFSAGCVISILSGAVRMSIT